MVTIRTSALIRGKVTIKVTIKAVTGVALCAALAITTGVGAQAQDAAADFPNRNLRVIIPYTPGAASDIISRALAIEASKVLGKTVVPENRDGAGSALGTQAANQAPADGYTILFGSNTMVAVMHGMKTPGYKMSDFTPVAMLGEQSYALMTPAGMPTTLKEYVAYAKANPSKMNYALLGPGAPSHVLADRFGRAAGFEWQGVPFRGGAPALQAVMANDMQAYVATATFASAHLNSDKVRILAVAGDQRSEFLPGIPTFKELGYEGVVERGWFAWLVRSNTPPAVVAKLRATLSKVMESNQMKAELRKLGLAPYNGRIEDFSAAVEKESAEKAIENKRLGIVPE